MSTITGAYIALLDENGKQVAIEHADIQDWNVLMRDINAMPDVVEALREAINWADGYAQGGVIPEYLKAARAALAKLEDVS